MTIFIMENLSDLFEKGLKNWEIQYVLRETYGVDISIRHLKRKLKELGLKRRNYSDMASVIHFIQNELRQSGQLHGYRMMASRCKESGLTVRMEDVRIILLHLDPLGVSLRRSRCIRRRAYSAPGPNFIWHFDGYDKLKPFGLCISGCICGFSRRLIWLNVYHTNNDPRVIGGYFLEAVRRCGGCPRFVRGDYGTENGHVRNFQTFFRRNYPDHERSYIDGASTANQRIESWWGYLRRHHVQYWIETFRDLQDNGSFNGDFLDKSLLQFCFLAILQDELDRAFRMWNNHHIRRSSNYNVPSGRPEQMYNFPLLWNAEDHLVAVPDTDVSACCRQAEFRSVIPCDEDVYDICVALMHGQNLSPAKTCVEAMQLYLYLRRELLSIL